MYRRTWVFVNSLTSTLALSLRNDTTLPATGFLGFLDPQETKHCNTVHIRLLLLLHQDSVKPANADIPRLVKLWHDRCNRL
jgi:hypothetical protein